MKEITNIINLSGGKDSTAMLLMMLEKRIKVGQIVFYDTGWDFPEMIRHLDKLEKYIGRKIVRLKNRRKFKEYFKKRGFPTFRIRWCTGLKRDAIAVFCTPHKPYIQYIGFGYDERKRIKRTIGFCYPLVDWKVTQKDALKYCKLRGFDWDGLYDKYERISCWNCPLQTLKDLKMLWKYFPKYWQELIKMQKQSKYLFRVDYTLEELDEKFRKEEKFFQLELGNFN